MGWEILIDSLASIFSSSSAMKLYGKKVPSGALKTSLLMCKSCMPYITAVFLLPLLPSLSLSLTISSPLLGSKTEFGRIDGLSFICPILIIGWDSKSLSCWVRNTPLRLLLSLGETPRLRVAGALWGIWALLLVAEIWHSSSLLKLAESSELLF